MTSGDSGTRELVAVGLGLWWMLSVGTWDMTDPQSMSIRPGPGGRGGRRIPPRSDPQAQIQRAAELAFLSRCLSALIGVTANGKPPKSTTRRDALRGFVVSAAWLALALGFVAYLTHR